MNKKEEILKTIWIGFLVVIFLLNTGRGLQATELCNECLILLNNLTLGVEDQFKESFYRDIYEVLFNAFFASSGFTNAERYARKLLDMFHYAGILTMKLGEKYKSQSRFLEAKTKYKNAVNIMQTIRHKREEALAYESLGNLHCSLCEYQKSKEYCEKALAITIEICDREGEGNSYANLGTVLYSLGEYQKAK